MATPRELSLIGVLSLAALVIVGLVLTTTPPQETESVQTEQQEHVDQRPLDTANKLLALATTPEEQPLAQNAVRIADHEVDLAFDMALRAAAQQSAARQTEETLRIQARVQDASAKIKAAQEQVKRLSELADKAQEADRDRLGAQLELARAELTLDQDQLADANEDLARAGGDQRSAVQRLLAEHDALQHQSDTARTGTGSGRAGDSIASPSSLLARWNRWNALRMQRSQLHRAKQDADHLAAALGGSHQALEAQVRQDHPQGALSREPTNAAMSALRRLSVEEKNLADLDKRLQDARQLATIYQRWDSLVLTRQRASRREVIQSVLLIVATVLLAYLACRWIDHLFKQSALERKQRMTLRAVARFAVHALAVIAVLVAIFGSPYQLSTIVGLIGAGLTLSLKEFIVAIFGWFVLMGPNGIRIGDWVEIKGVRGEVAQIGLWRTVLLETTTGGRPTGRHVVFLNNFAVEGHYFNFSTSGQWLWDELLVFIPSGKSPYGLVEEIQTVLAKETEGSARIAEEDWDKAIRRYGARPLSAAPELGMRTTDRGVEVIVRYVTRAPEQSHVRARLNRAVVELLHHGATETPTDTLPVPSTTNAGVTSTVRTAGANR